MGVPQMPTTLPTLDELIGLNHLTEANVDQGLLERTSLADQHHVYTLHAELEGMRLSRVFERLLSGWEQQNYRLVSCHDLYNTLDISKLPRHSVAMGDITGRSGVLALQGPAAARFS